VSVTSTDVTGIDVTMPLGLHITGTVTGPDGQPLSDIYFNVGGGNPNFVGTSTGSDGSYSLAVPPDTYTVQFWDNSGAYAAGCYSASAPGHFSTDQSACTPVAADTSDVTGIDVTMPLAFQISGKVTGPDGTPLSNINVNAVTANSNFFAITAADGTYSLSVPAGSYTLGVVDYSGAHINGCYASSASGGFTSDWGGSADQIPCTPVSVTTSDVTGIDVTMPTGVGISGTVTDTDGKPLAGINVDIWTASNGCPCYATRSDSSGHYAVRVSAGSYKIYVGDPTGTYASGYYSASGFTLDNNAATPVDPTAGDATGIDVSMPHGVRIAGTVTDADGRPLAGINVVACVPGTCYGPPSITDGSGHYVIALLPGTYTVQLSDPNGVYPSGYYTASGFSTDSNAATTIGLTTSDVTGIDVTMAPGPH
jgi:hypothetical protein